MRQFPRHPGKIVLTAVAALGLLLLANYARTQQSQPPPGGTTNPGPRIYAPPVFQGYLGGNYLPHSFNSNPNFNPSNFNPNNFSPSNFNPNNFNPSWNVNPFPNPNFNPNFNPQFPNFNPQPANFNPNLQQRYVPLFNPFQINLYPQQNPWLNQMPQLNPQAVNPFNNIPNQWNPLQQQNPWVNPWAPNFMVNPLQPFQPLQPGANFAINGGFGG